MKMFPLVSGGEAYGQGKASSIVSQVQKEDVHLDLTWQFPSL